MTTESIDVAIGILDNKVVLRFPMHIDHISLDVQNTLDIAEAMAAAAFKLKNNGVQPAGPALKASLVERHHDKLVPRVALMLGTLRDDRTKSNGALALTIVDTVFAEVF